MDDFYKGYILTNGKQPIEKIKDRVSYRTLEDVRNSKSYAGILSEDSILIDIDDEKQSDIMMNIVEDLQLNCRVYQTTRGRHFLFKNHKINKCYTHVNLACGLIADIKVGFKTSYESLKVNGEERFLEWDIEGNQTYDELPYFMRPISKKIDFISMKEGDGRNQELFNYILTLQSNTFTVEQSKEIIRMINRYVLNNPLDENELEVIIRDEAFQKPTFMDGKNFMFDKFAEFLKNNNHIVRINGQLHVYNDGVYTDGYKEIERIMISIIPNLRKAQRQEVISYIELIAEEAEIADARYIGFRNGVYDIVNNELLPFSSDIVITNKINWDYDESSYNELTDNTLDKLSCNDKSIRALLEECIGYCFYRRNELGKAFILTGDKSNGKSTFLDVLKNILNEENISALDLKELGDRFSTSMMFGKLANIGDDIGDEFMMGTQVAVFKKIVTGNRIKAEKKGQDPFEFNPYIKLLFAANDIPRMRDKTGAVLRRLVIIPFNATFSKDDVDYDPFIKYKLCEQSSIEYLIKLGIEGLKRVLINNSFTESNQVEKEIKQYEEENNPIIGFMKEVGEKGIINQPTSDVYKIYQVYCADNNLSPSSRIVFTKQICQKLDVMTYVSTINKKSVRIFKREE